MNEDNAVDFFEDESGNKTSGSQRTVVGCPHGSATPAVIPKQIMSSPQTESSSVGQPSNTQDAHAATDDAAALPTTSLNTVALKASTNELVKKPKASSVAAGSVNRTRKLFSNAKLNVCNGKRRLLTQ